MSEKNKGIKRTQDFINRTKEGNKKYWSNEENLKKHSAMLKDLWKNNNIAKQKIKDSWKDREKREKRLRNIIKSSNKKPNKPETTLMKLIEKNNLPFNYVGNRGVIIGGFNPDFLSKNPKHIIEMFGDYWHNLPNVRERDKKRLKAYKEYGYKTLIIWEHELNNLGSVVNKINKFIGE